jgi:hypothetical protein
MNGENKIINPGGVSDSIHHGMGMNIKLNPEGVNIKLNPEGVNIANYFKSIESNALRKLLPYIEGIIVDGIKSPDGSFIFTPTVMQVIYYKKLTKKLKKIRPNYSNEIKMSGGELFVPRLKDPVKFTVEGELNPQKKRIRFIKNYKKNNNEIIMFEI